MLFLIGLLWSGSVQAQAGGGDFLRSIGKIYVVVAVIVAVFLGIIFFLIYLDRRLTNIENQIDHHEQ
jgi:CcmD family protein